MSENKRPREINWDNARWVIMALVKKVYQTGPYRALGWEREDLEQECLLYVVQRINDYDPSKAAFTTWAYNSANWALLHMKDESHNFIRIPKGAARVKENRDKIRKKKVRLDGWSRENRQWSGTSQIKDHREPTSFKDHVGLHQAMAKLNPVTRQIIEMAYGIGRDEKVSPEDIAKEFNLPVHKVKSKIKEGLGIIQRNLDYYGLGKAQETDLEEG